MRDAWRCPRCETLNLAGADACRRCGADRSLAWRRARHARDDAGLAAALSLLLPGAGQLYTGQIARALTIVLLPTITAGAVVGLLTLIDPLLAAALRFAVGLAAAATVMLAVYHGAVVLDAFGAPSTAGVGARGKSGRDYLVLGVALLALVIGYVALYRQTTAWAAIASRVFAPFQQSGGATRAPAWRGNERLNVLLLGIDTRKGHESESQNTDTVIVLSVDPVNRAAAMLSIPRDTIVAIPSHGEGKVNAAFAIGGAELARRTVSDFLDVPIHGYALVDFVGFRRIVDALGGIIVDAPLPVRDDEYPTEDFGVTRVHIRAGPQLMDGETALRYTRSRHGSNDFSRAERQQRLLSSLKRRASETRLLLRLPSLGDELGDAVKTDLDPANALPLARLASEIDLKDIDSAVLRPPGERGVGQLREINSPAGYYLEPVPNAVRELVAELFYDPRVRAEAARVEIRAPPWRGDAARALGDTLSDRRYQVVRVSVVPEQRRTVVIARDGRKRYSAEQLSRLLGANLTDGGVEADADVVVMVGDDYRGTNGR